MFLSKLKEALICWRAKRVTRRYPFEPSPVPEGFRGQPTIDIEKCIGCTACSMACPTRCIEIEDGAEERTTVYHLERCSYCGRCEEACPEGAITLSDEFELATDTIEDVRITTHHELVRCVECGEVVGTRRQIEKLKAELPDEVELSEEQLTWLSMCSECKRRYSLQTASRLRTADESGASTNTRPPQGT